MLLVLTTFQVPLFMVHFAQSNLYRRWEIPEPWRHALHSKGIELLEFGAVTAALSPFQQRPWEDLPGCDSPDQPHLHPHGFWHRHQSWPLGKGEASAGGTEIIFVVAASERVPFKALLCAEFRWCSQVMFQKPVGFGCFGRVTSAWPSTRLTFRLSRSFRCCTTPETATSFWRSASWYLLFCFSPDLIYCSSIN